jgi:hypothetical protein
MEMKIGHALLGLQAVDAILYDEGEERKLPFKIKYKLFNLKNKLMEEVNIYEDERVKLIKEFGSEYELEDGGTTVEVRDEDKRKEFFVKLQEVLDTEIASELPVIQKEDLGPIEELEIDITGEQLGVFFQFLVAN